MTYLTEHFSLEEVTHSELAERKGINNTVPDILLLAVRKTALGMEKIRSCLNKPLNVSSWYRCLELNTLLGSKETSQHLKAEAVDFSSPTYGSPVEVCKVVVANADLIRFDQLILEHTWIHVSFNSVPGGVQRNQVLSLLSSGKYATGLTDKEGKLYV